MYVYSLKGYLVDSVANAVYLYLIVRSLCECVVMGGERWEKLAVPLSVWRDGGGGACCD